MKLINVICITIAFFVQLSLSAQVTVGLNDEPANGALLQLKDREADTPGAVNASKGLALPRVKLTKRDQLYPMFETSQGSGVANSNYNTAAKKQEQDAAHTGLMVYSLSNCDLEGSGVYTWNGSLWQKLGNKIGGPLNISSASGFIELEDFPGWPVLYLPSGQDLVPYTAKDLKFSWSGTAPAVEVLADEIPFTANPYYPFDFTRSPLALSLLPDKMSASDTFGTKLTAYTFSDPECGGDTTIIFLQKNHGITVSYRTSSYGLTIFPGTSLSFPVKTNYKWTPTISDPNNMITSITPAVGTTNGSEGYSADTQKTLSVTLNQYSKYYKADITFVDTQTPKRVKDFTLSLTSCVNEPSLEAWTARLGTAQDEIAPNGVAWHKDQNGNIFFSADFGTAGRWMTTNLAATSYAPEPRTDGKTGLPALVNAITGNNNYTIPAYVYPQSSSSGDPTDQTIYLANKRYGVFYNYAASSALRQYAGVGEEGIVHEVVQGICPNGWHVPSDREWTTLENEILHKTSKYSNLQDQFPDNAQYYDYIYNDNAVGSGRPETLVAKAMRDICEPNSFYFENSSSNILTDGGFNIVLAGSSTGSDMNASGSVAIFTVSSFSPQTNTNGSVYYRYIGSATETDLKKGAAGRMNYWSVRCVKD